MKFRSLIAVLALSVSAIAQSNLPSAPSASQQKTFPGGTAPAAQQQPSAPATQPQSQPAVPPVNAPAQQPAAPAQQQPAPQEQKPADMPAVNAPGQSQQQAPATGQQGKEIQQNEEGQYSLTTTVNEINMVFTVTDKHGRFIKDLKQDDFRILDDGKPPRTIDFFSAETGLPLRVGLLIDASNSIRDRFRFEQESAVEFLNQIVRHKSDQAFVVGFDSTAELKQDLTDDTNKLAAGVRDLRPGGGTALYDAIYSACHDRLAHVKASGPIRKAIIVLSDGEDNQSRVLRDEALEMAQRSEVIIYAISTNISGVKNRGDKVLEYFAERTGGRVFFPYKLQDVADAFTGIQEELRSQYAVAYKPQDFAANGKFRSVDIEPTKNKNIRIRARKGYFAPGK